MRHITYGTKSFLLGDEVADLLIRYTAALASAKLGDSVLVHAIGSDGDSEEVQVLLDTGAPIMAESATSEIPEPDNSEAEEYMRGAMRALMTSPAAESLDDLAQEQLERTTRDIDYI